MSENNNNTTEILNANDITSGYDPRFVSVFLNQARKKGFSEFDLAKGFESMEATNIKEKVVKKEESSIGRFFKKIFPFLVTGAASGAVGYAIAKHRYDGDLIIHHFDDGDIID